MHYIVTLFTLLFFVGCAQPSTKNSENLKPYWVENENFFQNSFAVGFSKRSAQGSYMQRQSAWHDASSQLAHKIKSSISSKESLNISLYNTDISTLHVKDIEAFSRVALSDIEQYDAYINENGELYLLVGFADNPLHVERKNLKKFENSKLLSSSCYDKKTLLDIHTSAYMYKDRPIWFYAPKGGSIGIAPKTTRGFIHQKRVALMLAKMNLVKKERLKTDSKRELMQLIKHDESASVLSSEATHTSSSKLQNRTVQDIWLDPKSCELYMYII
ncbi:MAG: hypothetical protein U9N42_01545 [Campylobacterota bacterium]|nr:hypothetical protein [Campylobacterota bacterium]